MNVDTMMAAFRCSRARAQASHAGMNQAMAMAGCTTVRRAAMWAAQIGHETLSLYYDQEIWGPTDAQRRYEGRADLGNTQPGDGYRFRGRGRIQLTGRANFTAFSRWCHEKRLVPAADHFVRNPDLVATAPWRELAATWYWTVARPGINGLADRGDVRGVTRLINGGTNGLTDRQDRYDGAVRLGDALLPTATATIHEEDELSWTDKIPDRYGPNLPPMSTGDSLAWATAHAAHARDAARQAVGVATRVEAQGLRVEKALAELTDRLAELPAAAPAPDAPAGTELAEVMYRLTDLELRLRALEKTQERP